MSFPPPRQVVAGDEVLGRPGSRRADVGPSLVRLALVLPLPGLGVPFGGDGRTPPSSSLVHGPSVRPSKGRSRSGCGTTVGWDARVTPWDPSPGVVQTGVEWEKSPIFLTSILLSYASWVTGRIPVLVGAPVPDEGATTRTVRGRPAPQDTPGPELVGVRTTLAPRPATLVSLVGLMEGRTRHGLVPRPSSLPLQPPPPSHPTADPPLNPRVYVQGLQHRSRGSSQPTGTSGSSWTTRTTRTGGVVDGGWTMSRRGRRDASRPWKRSTWPGTDRRTWGVCNGGISRSRPPPTGRALPAGRRSQRPSGRTETTGRGDPKVQRSLGTTGGRGVPTSTRGPLKNGRSLHDQNDGDRYFGGSID